MNSLYGTSLALLTDLYQLSMGQTYFDKKMHETRATFSLFFRKAPFGGAFAVAAGMGDALDYIRDFKLSDDDVFFLMEQTGNDGRALFSADYLSYLRKVDMSDVEVSGAREGSVVFPNQPLLVLTGPLLKVQLLETALLTIVNFQTLVATKAARVKMVAGKRTVLEFGLRRAQGIDGGLTASKAAYAGGVDATSNVLAGRLFGIPVKGTHAHSLVMAFKDEAKAFSAYATSQPNNLTFLVDTYDTVQGVKNAIAVANTLPKGTPFGIRLDSGDLAELSKVARKMLDEAGYTNAKIVASGDLDEYEITKLDAKGAQIDVFGVGTNLVTCADQPALGGVYKLNAIHNGRYMESRIKVSENPIKTTIPGVLTGTSYYNAKGERVLDVLGEDGGGRKARATVTMLDGTVVPTAGLTESGESRVVRLGERESLKVVRARAQREIAALPAEYRALKVSNAFPVALDNALFEMRERMIAETRAVEAKVSAA